MKTAICIPTYKNRYAHILGNVKNIDPVYDILLFFSGNDFEESNYTQYDLDAPNIHIIHTNCKSLAEKRQYMIDYVIEHNYDGMFQIDDTVQFMGMRITEATKRTTSDSYKPEIIDINIMLHKIEDTTYEYNAAFGSPMFRYAIGFSKPGKVNVNQGINFGQLTFMDVAKIKESGIKYDTVNVINHDVDFVFELLRHGYTCITLGDYAFQPDFKNMYGCALLDQFGEHIGMYLKYRDGISLTINPRTNLLSMRCNLKKYWNTIEIPVKNDAYHQGLYEVCLTRDEEKIREYITSNDNGRKKA